MTDDGFTHLDEAGDPACWLNLCCPECGAVREATGTFHLEWCPLREPPPVAPALETRAPKSA